MRTILIVRRGSGHVMRRDRIEAVRVNVYRKERTEMVRQGTEM